MPIFNEKKNKTKTTGKKYNFTTFINEKIYIHI